MQSNAQDLTVYFESLKKELKSKSRKQNFKSFLMFFVLIQGIAIGIHYFFINYLITPGQLVGNAMLYSVVTMAFIFSLFFWLSISINTNIRILKNTNSVNLYDALQYLHREKKTNLSDEDFINFIDAKYEKERLRELLVNVNENKYVYAQTTENINTAYRNKEATVSVENILEKELKS